MSYKEKLITRFLSSPKDFTFDELKTMLGYLGYSLKNAGKTSGSRVTFEHQTYEPIKFHKPHPSGILPSYLIKQIKETLQQRNQI